MRWSPAVGAADDSGWPRIGVDRLVAVGIVERTVDVGRERHLTGRREAVGQIGVGLGGQRHEPQTVVQLVAHLDLQAGRIRRVGQHRARRQPSARTHERLPAAGSEIGAPVEEQHLGRTTGGLDQVEAGRQHPRGVDHHQVTGIEQAGQVADLAVLDARPAIDQEARRIALIERHLCDARLGQVVVEVGRVHRRRA